MVLVLLVVVLVMVDMFKVDSPLPFELSLFGSLGLIFGDEMYVDVQILMM
jgi:hypothetical protein